MKPMPKIRSMHKEERGDTLLEFAISAVVVFTLLFGIMEFARAMYLYHFVSYAAQAGTRYAIVRGSSWSTACSSSTTGFGCNAANTDVTAYVKSIAPPGVDTSKLTVSATWPGTAAGSSGSTCTDTKTKTNSNNPGCIVQVQVTYPFTFIAPFMPKATPTFSATSQQAIQQ
jgi:Flp pilus assembly protein TadG